MMALSFSCLIIPFFIFFVFPSLSCSCRSNPVFPPCGNVEVRFPFYTNYSDSNPTKNTASVSPNIPRENTTNPECRGHHLVVCHGSTPIILFNGHEPWYVLETIDYALSTITIQGQELSNKLNTPDCIFLYHFDPPIDLSGNLSLPHFVGQNQTFFNCMPGAYNFSADIFYKIYNRTPCKDYELHFSNRQEDKGLDHSECWNGASLFEWELSFGGVGDGLSLRSAKYLHQRTWRWACVEHSTRRDFKCLCDKGCQKNSHTGRTIGIGNEHLVTPSSPVSSKTAQFLMFLNDM